MYTVGAEGNASADVDHHLEMGKRLLAAGQLTEALSHYHSAVGMYIPFQQLYVGFDILDMLWKRKDCFFR